MSNNTIDKSVCKVYMYFKVHKKFVDAISAYFY